MAKVHRRYKYTWWEDRFNSRGLFGYRQSYVSPEKTQDTNGLSHMTKDQYVRFLRSVLVKMDEAKTQYGEFDQDYFTDDTIPVRRNLKAERVYAAAMGVSPRYPSRVGSLTTIVDEAFDIDDEL